METSRRASRGRGTPGVFSWLPRIAVAPDDPDRVYVLWQEIVFSGGTHGGEIFFARSTDGGRTFSEPRNLSGTPAGDGKGRYSERFWLNGSLDLVAGSGGGVYAAWTEYEGRLWFRRSTEGGRSFGDRVLVAGASEAEPPATGPSLALGPADTVYLAWGVGQDADADLRLATSADGGRSFGEPRLLFPSPGFSHAPKVGVDHGGILHLVWSESPSGFSGPSHVLHARSRHAGRRFDAVATVSRPLPEGGEAAGYPDLALDEAGDPHVVLELFPDPGSHPRGTAVASSGDGGRTFSAPAVLPGSTEPGVDMNASLQGLFSRKLALGPGGSVALVHGTFVRGRESRIRLYLGRLTGR